MSCRYRFSSTIYFRYVSIVSRATFRWSTCQKQIIFPRHTCATWKTEKTHVFFQDDSYNRGHVYRLNRYWEYVNTITVSSSIHGFIIPYVRSELIFTFVGVGSGRRVIKFQEKVFLNFSSRFTALKQLLLNCYDNGIWGLRWMEHNWWEKKGKLEYDFLCEREQIMILSSRI